MSQPSSVNVEAFLDKSSNTFSYVVFDNSKQAIVIDPVLEFDYASGKTNTQGADAIIAFITDNQLTLNWILETHAHADHLSAAPHIKRQLRAPIAIGEHITDVQAIFKRVYNLEKTFLPDGTDFDRLLKDGDTLQAGDMTVRVLHTPGHTAADVTYLINEKFAFVGDTLFSPDLGTARCDFPGGSAHRLYQSIQTLFQLPDATQVFICHDYPPETREHQYQTTIGAQKQQNVHVGQQASESDFVQLREARDATLSMPKLIIPSIQVNIRAGHLPEPEDNDTVYLKIPLNRL